MPDANKAKMPWQYLAYDLNSILTNYLILINIIIDFFIFVFSIIGFYAPFLLEKKGIIFCLSEL
jgi:hypothetical protein